MAYVKERVNKELLKEWTNGRGTLGRYDVWTVDYAQKSYIVYTGRNYDVSIHEPEYEGYYFFFEGKGYDFDVSFEDLIREENKVIYRVIRSFPQMPQDELFQKQLNEAMTIQKRYGSINFEKKIKNYNYEVKI